MSDIAKAKSMETHALNRAVEHLMGLITGIVADGALHDMEIRFLRTWLTENASVTRTWPGFVVQRQVEAVMADGIITETERAHLLGTLSSLSSSDFAVTGSAGAEVAALPIDDAVTVDLCNASVCHTGEFLYGTRAACERATLKAGGTCVDAVTKNCEYLIVGTRVSPDWVHTSFGKKIQRALELQAAGHSIEVISERRWLEALC